MISRLLDNILTIIHHDLESMAYKNHKEELKCNFLKCLAGLGVAGNEVCFLGGTPNKKECKQFIDEEEWLKKRGEK